MTIEIKLKNRREFMRDLEREISGSVQREYRKEQNKLLAALRRETPVDTGEARDGWEFVNNNLAFFDVFSREISSDLRNSVSHIVYLNQGSSTQAPAFFIERVLSRIGTLS